MLASSWIVATAGVAGLAAALASSAAGGSLGGCPGSSPPPQPAGASAAIAAKAAKVRPRTVSSRICMAGDPSRAPFTRPSQGGHPGFTGDGARPGRVPSSPVSPPNVETTAELWALPGLSADRREAMADAWRAFWTSRIVVWAAGIAAIVIFGWFTEMSARLDPLQTTLPFDGDFGNLLAAPAARCDSAWYLAIAEHGYTGIGRPAFYPLYPGLAALGGGPVGSPLLVGVTISVSCGLVALYALHRLVSFDFGSEIARTTVWIVAWYPSALVLSAVYTESRFLALSIGAVDSGRRGRWAAAGILGGLAAATRSGGLVLLVPLLILYLYGPRADRPSRELPGGSLGTQHPLRPDVLWILLGVPAGLAAYVAYLGIATGDPFSAFAAQAVWHRTFIPLGGIALGIWSAVEGAYELVVPGVGRPPSEVAHGVPPELLAVRDIVLCAFMLLAGWLLVQCGRRLPAAYTAYALAGLALPLSVPAQGHALMSLPRFMLALFPLWIALALWAIDHGRVRRVLWTSGALLAVSSALFTTWSFAP